MEILKAKIKELETALVMANEEIEMQDKCITNLIKEKDELELKFKNHRIKHFKLWDEFLELEERLKELEDSEDGEKNWGLKCIK